MQMADPISRSSKEAPSIERDLKCLLLCITLTRTITLKCSLIDIYNQMGLEYNENFKMYQDNEYT